MTDDLTRTIPRSVWHGWGDPAERHTLPSHAWAFLEREIGARPIATPDLPVALADVVLPEPALPEAARAALEAVVGELRCATTTPPASTMPAARACSTWCGSVAATAACARRGDLPRLARGSAAGRAGVLRA